MGRKMVEVETLHGYTIDGLLEMKNTLKSPYSYTVLLTITMRYQNIHTDEISRILGISKPTVLGYIRNWNELGTKALKDHRGGSVGNFSEDMLNDLKDTIVHKCPVEEGFSSYTWTCSMLADYIEKKYNIKYSSEWIRRILMKNRLSYKRGQYKPSLASEADQEAFKKNTGPSRYCRRFF